MGLYLGFGAWLRLRDGWVVPLAALLFSSLWTTVLYGFQAMPNEWVAFAALASCGQLLTHLATGSRPRLVAAALALAVVALFRPSDAAFAGVGLALACGLVAAPVRRRLVAVAALVAGAVLGAAQWVVEAETSYGGLAARLHAAQEENGGGGIYFTGGVHAELLGGRLVCAAGCGAETDLLHQAWWIALGLLVVVGLVGAARTDRLRTELAPVVVALAMAAQYLLTLTLAAPRFLLPTYALLALTAAAGARVLLRSVRPGRARTAVAVGLLAVLVAHTAVQVSVLTGSLIPAGRRNAVRYDQTTRDLRALGIRPPCLVLRRPADNALLAYSLGCTNQPTRAAGVSAALASGTRAAWLDPDPPPRSYGRGWTKVDVLDPGTGRPETAWVHVGG